jgi:Protein of unknown function (DUF732)
LLPHPSQQRSIFAAPAYADPDTDFANQLHSYGIYGPRDTNAWFGKITCQRLNNHLDTDAYKSADFLAKNLPKGSTSAQVWQFLGAAISTYCPDSTYVLQAAAQHN